MQNEIDFETYSLPWKNEKGHFINIPALDQRWCEDREFSSFFALTSMEKVKVDSWCLNTMTLIQHCKWLLRLPHHKFWSFVVYGDKSLHEMLDSYLLNCPRYSESYLMNLTFFSTKNKISDLQNTLHRRIFLIFLRMSTRREGEFVMTTEFFGKIIYDNFLFDVPRLMDFCAVYGHDNERTVMKMIENIFKSQPKYYNDIKECCSVLMMLFDKCEKSLDTRVGEKVQLLTNRPNRYDDRVTLDAVFYLVDVVYSLSWFIKFCPKSLDIFHENGLTDRLPSLYENTYPILYEVIPDDGEKFIQHHNMMGRLAYFEKTLTQIFRDFVRHNSLDYLLGKLQILKKPKEEYLDDFLNSISHVLHEKHFAAVYNETFPFADDVKDLSDKHVEIDQERLIYFTEAFLSLPPIEPKSEAINGQVIRDIKVLDNDNPPKLNAAKEIRDIFPDLSLDFIEKVLAYFDQNAENAVHALCSDDLPLELRSMKNGQNAEAGSTSYLNNNITTDDDEIVADIWKQTEDEQEDEMNAYLVPITSSKKRGLGQSVEDKNAVKTAQAVYDRYQFETPDDDKEDEEEARTASLSEFPDEVKPFEIKPFNVYDDEYDDTYDGHNVNVEGDTVPDEAIASYYRRSRSTVDKEEPEEASAAVRTDSRAQGETGNDTRSYRGSYTGGRDRQNKERNKGRAAHHNRKDGALHKHSRGFGFY